MFLSVNGSRGFSAVGHDELEKVNGGLSAGTGGAVTLPGLSQEQRVEEAIRNNSANGGGYGCEAGYCNMLMQDGPVPLFKGPLIAAAIITAIALSGMLRTCGSPVEL